MKTFERYFFSELLLKLSATTLVLAIVIAGQLLSKLLSRVSAGKYPLEIMPSLLLYGTLDSLILLLPFASMLAVTLTVGRYYRDSEIHAAFSFGIRQSDICRILIKCVLPLSCLLFVLVMEVSPAGEQRYQMARQRGDIEIVTTGRFFSPRDGTVFFIDDRNRSDNTLHRLFIARFTDGEKIMETARFAEQDHDAGGSRSFRLHDGRVHKGRVGQNGYHVFSYREHAISLPPRASPQSVGDPEMMGFLDLLGSERLEDRVELQWRLITVVSLPILTLLAFVSSRVPPRRSHNFAAAITILIFLFYQQLVILLMDRIDKGELALFPGAWLVPAFALAAVMLALSDRRFRIPRVGNGR